MRWKSYTLTVPKNSNNPYFSRDYSTSGSPVNRTGRLWYREVGSEFTFTVGKFLPQLNVYAKNINFSSNDLDVSTPELSPLFNLDLVNDDSAFTSLGEDVYTQYKQHRGY